MTRHPLEQTIERFVTGSMTTDAIFALGKIRHDEPLDEEARERLQRIHDLFDGMTQDDITLSGVSREDTRRRLDVWEMLGTYHPVVDQDKYLEMLRDATGIALAADHPEWNTELEELQNFLSALGEYELAKMNEERGGCF